MKEQFITFETAKLAKEKGFDIPTIQFYTSGKKAYLSEAEDYMTERYAESNWNNGRGSYPTEPEKVSCSAPTQSLLQKWLREQYSIYVTVLPYRDSEAEIELCFYYSLIQGSEELDDILCNEDHLGASSENFDSYEKALEKGLQEALKLIEP